MDNTIITNTPAKVEPQKGNGKLFAWLGLGLAVWIIIYAYLQRAANFISFNVFNLSPSSHLGGSVSFFLLDTPKVMMLLVLVVFGIGTLSGLSSRRNGHGG